MDLFLMFYNMQGNKKLAIALDNKHTVLSELTEITGFINTVCEVNTYNFSFYKKSVNGDFKNIPIIPINILVGDNTHD